MIAREFLNKIRLDPDLKLKDIQNILKDKNFLIVAVQHYYMRKCKALNILIDLLEEHYAKLRSYKAELLGTNRDGRFDLVLDINPPLVSQNFKDLYRIQCIKGKI